MSSIIEDRLYKYLYTVAKNGRVVLKVDEIAEALAESKGPVYNALKSLDKKKKIKAESRGKMGFEIIIPEIYNTTNEASETNQIIQPESKDNTKFYEPASVNLEQVLNFIRSSDLDKLNIIKDYVEISVIKKSKEV